jgi:hypothetical protein
LDLVVDDSFGVNEQPELLTHTIYSVPLIDPIYREAFAALMPSAAASLAHPVLFRFAASD